MPDLPATVSYQGWLDTRTLPFPGEADRTCDTVACFHDGAAAEWWAIPVEFQIEPDREMFGRFLEFLGRLWRELRPAADGTARYMVGAAVVNLTERGAASRDMVLGPTGPRTHLQVIERNLADEDAGETLAGIAAGRITGAILPWIPLMRDGGEPGIIERGRSWRWRSRTVGGAEYGVLALVFAEPVGRRHLWKQALEKWNMMESTGIGVDD